MSLSPITDESKNPNQDMLYDPNRDYREYIEIPVEDKSLKTRIKRKIKNLLFNIFIIFIVFVVFIIIGLIGSSFC